MTDIRQTPQYAKYMRGLGWKAEKISGVYYFIKKFPIIGHFVKIQRYDAVLNEDDLKKLSNKYKIFRIVTEPQSINNGLWLMDNKFKQTASYSPSKTLQLNLTPTQKRLYQQLKKDCKYSLRKNIEHRTKCIEENNIERFHKNWKASVPFSRYVPSLNNLTSLKKAFGDNCLLLSCSRTQELNKAGAVFLKSKDIGYYWFAFTNKESRKNLVQYKILWEGILWAKKRGAKKFDFEGIYDKRFPNKKWLGFTHFKKSFGGYEVEFPGAFSNKSFWRL